EAVESLSIGLPLDAKLSETSTILPPPLFGKPYVRKKDNPDLMRGRKRKNNRGEGAAKSSRSEADLPNLTTEGLNDEETKHVAVFFRDSAFSSIHYETREKSL
ncbi:hypothetical protein F441_09260, partial [Phytophthora nicotianae CJ01A1]